VISQVLVMIASRFGKTSALNSRGRAFGETSYRFALDLKVGDHEDGGSSTARPSTASNWSPPSRERLCGGYTPSCAATQSFSHSRSKRNEEFSERFASTSPGRVVLSKHLSIAVIVGSLRKASFSRKVANALISQAPVSLGLQITEIGDLPLYNEDLDRDPPDSWIRFRSDIAKADAILFVTPEYNRSMPACLKNAIDIGSRPEGKNLFDGLPAGVVSVTPYKMGAFGANHALRQTFVFLNLLVMQQPEAYIGGVGELFDERGVLTSEETRAFLDKFLAAFNAWITTVVGGSDVRSFDAFLKRREKIAFDYVNGEPESLAGIVTRRDPATFFSPKGDHERGADAIAKRYTEDDKAFCKPGESRLEVFQSGASGGLGFWTGLQHAEIRMAGEDNPISMTLRITEVFRLEGGEWALVHRHADTAKPSESQN
jgi:NAD(P)H-dependent FMN reductase/ketosteroid isomerase-like protein